MMGGLAPSGSSLIKTMFTLQLISSVSIFKTISQSFICAQAPIISGASASGIQHSEIDCITFHSGCIDVPLNCWYWPTNVPKTIC